MIKPSKRTERARGWRRGYACLTLLIALALLGAVPALSVENPEQSGWTRANSTGRKAFDLVILRPLQVVQVAVSAAVFVPAYPVSLLLDGDEDVLEICITEPVERAFRRPLGDL